MPARSTVRIQVKNGIQVQDLVAIIERIGGPSGCRTCGLGGFDVHFAVDPGPELALNKELQGAAGFEGVVITG
jgi:hypothetical protein